MLSQETRDLITKLDLPYCPVAVKFCFNRPEGYRLKDPERPLCGCIKDVQETGETYYIEAAEEGCMGKHVLGAVPIEPFAESGAVGFHHGIFNQQACNARLYYDIQFFKEGTVNFVLFGPAAEVDFDPDLLIFVAPTDKADIIMRATSFMTGDPYESKSTNVLGCHWLFNYPYMTGKVNFVITGMHFGMKRQGYYPPGLHIISIPFHKIPAFAAGLAQMEWSLPALSDDPADKALVARYYEKFDKAHDKDFPVDPKDRVRHG